MSITESEYVLYHLTKSAGLGHASKVRNLRKACAVTEAFITKHTIVKDFEVLVPNSDDPINTQIIINRGVSLFGTVTTNSHWHTWKVPISMLNDAIDFAFSEEDAYQNTKTLIRLFMRLDWNHLRTDTSNLSNSFYSKGSYLFISSLNSQTIFFNPMLLFSLAYDSPELKQFLLQLEPDLPFKIKDDCFYRVAKKSETGEKLVKLKKGWRFKN